MWDIVLAVECEAKCVYGCRRRQIHCGLESVHIFLITKYGST